MSFFSNLSNSLNNIKMPDFSNSDFQMDDSTTSIIVVIGLILIGFLIFRKLIKIAALVGIIFMAIYLFAH